MQNQTRTRAIVGAAGAVVLSISVWSGLQAQDNAKQLAQCNDLLARMEALLQSGRITDLNKYTAAEDEFEEGRKSMREGDIDNCIDALEEAFEHAGLPAYGPDPAAVRAAAIEAGLASLKGVAIPPVPNLNEFIRPDRKEQAILLGKALFWDMQVGSDGQACGSCHFSAGADNRLKNQINPGTRGGDTAYGVAATPAAAEEGVTASPFAANHVVQAGDFPFRLFKDAEEADYNKRVLLRDTNDVFSSQGVRKQAFAGIGAGPMDLGRPEADPVFSAKGINLRRVEPRNTPTMINATFNFDNFWDGRARNEFNGATPFGRLDDGARILVVENGTLTEKAVIIPNSSLASQAVGPPTNEDEMSFTGRNFAHVGRKLLGMRPLALQEVHPQDSVLGPLSRARDGLPGLAVATYAELARDVFQPNLWNATEQVVTLGATSRAIRPAAGAGADGFTQIEANFALFFGLAVQMYESTLVSDQSPFDRFMDGEDDALSQKQIAGLLIFINRSEPEQAANPLFTKLSPGNCVSCHTGPALTSAAIATAVPAGSRPQPITVRKMARMDGGEVEGDTATAFIDTGFANIGVRPTAEDLARGGTELGKPLSITRQALAGQGPSLPACGVNTAPACPIGVPGAPRIAVDGAFKIPSLRNVELTGPYFHNGGQMSLKQVIEFYDRIADFADVNIGVIDGNIASIKLEEDDEPLLTAFLLSLTDERVRQEMAPFDHPQIFVPSGHPADANGPSCAVGIIACDDRFESPAVGAGGRPAKGLMPLAAFLGGGLDKPAEEDEEDEEEDEDKEHK